MIKESIIVFLEDGERDGAEKEVLQVTLLCSDDEILGAADGSYGLIHEMLKP